MLNKIKNSKQIHIAIILFFLLTFIFFIYIYLNYNKNNKLITASFIYYNLIKSSKINDIESIKQKAHLLFHNHKNTSYFDLSCLFLSTLSLEKNNYIKGKYYLKNILKNKNSLFYDIANIRLLHILFQEKNYKTLLKNLKNISNNNTYIAIYEHLKGDTYSAINNEKKAKNAYSKALSYITKKNHKQLIKLKLKNLNN